MDTWPKIDWHCQECGKFNGTTEGTPPWDTDDPEECEPDCGAGYSMTMVARCHVCKQDLELGKSPCEHMPKESGEAANTRAVVEQFTRDFGVSPLDLLTSPEARRQAAEVMARAPESPCTTKRLEAMEAARRRNPRAFRC